MMLALAGLRNRWRSLETRWASREAELPLDRILIGGEGDMRARDYAALTNDPVARIHCSRVSNGGPIAASACLRAQIEREATSASQITTSRFTIHGSGIVAVRLL